MKFPTEQLIRAALLDRAQEFRRLTGIPISNISRLAVSDAAFLTRVRTGRNFTVKTYQRVHDWLTEHWPKHDSPG
jgi:hypothetical protein